jgi:hypothetical protein
VTSPKWRYGSVTHWHRPNVSMVERIDRKTGKIGAKVYVNTPDWKAKVHADIPCVFDDFDQMHGIGQAFAEAALALYGERGDT